jgi:spermidine synthase
MIPWKLLDAARVPGTGKKIELYQRAGQYSIKVEGCELMSSFEHESEDALAKLACARLSGRPTPRVLIGGLGMGFTTAEALRQLGPKGSVVVAELVPAVVEWNRGPLSDLGGHLLEDHRVTVRETDVSLVLQAENTYDAILLDVDNGPEGLTHHRNDWLYSRQGLNKAFMALRHEGVLAIWSASPDKAFSRRLYQTGFDVDEVTVRSRGPKKGNHHTIWLAGRRG